MTDEGWIRAERQHEREMAEIKANEDWRHRETITTRIGYIATAFGVVGVSAILAWLCLSWVKDSGQRGMELEKTCIVAGGTWTQFGGSTDKMCVYIDKVD